MVGGGIVGACAALELAGAGARVEVIERGGGWGEGCSWGNAGLLVPSHARPIAAPEALRSGLGWMLRPDTPFGLKLKPSLTPWLVRYLRASTARRARAGETLQRELGLESLALFQALGEAGIDVGVRTRGCLTVHTSPHAEDHAAAEAAGETGRALGAQALSGDQARELEPSLTKAVGAAVLFPAEADCDPTRLAQAIGSAAIERGASLRTRTEAYALAGGDGAVAVETTRGRIRTGHVVVAAGAWSGRLARTLGVRLPLQGGKGYAVEWDPAAARLRIPVSMHDQRCVANPMDDRTRITGGLLLDGLDERFDGRRVEAIAAAAQHGARSDGAPAARLARAAPVHARRPARDRRPPPCPARGLRDRARHAGRHPRASHGPARQRVDRGNGVAPRPGGAVARAVLALCGQRRWALMIQARESNTTPSSPVSWATIVACSRSIAPAAAVALRLASVSRVLWKPRTNSIAASTSP